MRQGIMSMAVAFTLWSTTPAAALPETNPAEGRETLTRALQGAWLPLEGGLVIGGREGTALSGKYEIDDGAFQLSIYTVKTDSASGDSFLEVIVDYSAGVVVRAEPLSDGGDLAAARAQKDAMERAKRSLAEATADVVKANTGYRAVSAIPRLDDGRPTVEVTLVRGDEWKIVNERLD
jgi:hypothetical protein